MDKSQTISELIDEISKLEEEVEENVEEITNTKEHLYELQDEGEALASRLKACENLLEKLKAHKGPVIVQEPFRPGQAERLMELGLGKLVEEQEKVAEDPFEKYTLE